MKLNIIYFIFFLLFSCGYSGNDKVVFNREIEGKFKLKKQKNSNSINLVFENTKEISTVLLQDCKSVFYDTTEKVLYTECYFNEYENRYYKMIIIKSDAALASEAYRNVIISKSSFDSLIHKPNILSISFFE